MKGKRFATFEKIEEKSQQELLTRIRSVSGQDTYIIGHCNPSVRILDLVSHTTYVVCVNFIHKWRDLLFKVDSERQIF